MISFNSLVALVITPHKSNTSVYPDRSAASTWPHSSTLVEFTVAARRPARSAPAI